MTTVVTSRSVVGSASTAAVSLFDTVANTAVQATNLINHVGTSVDMFGTFVQDAREKQLARSAVDMQSFYKELHEDAAKTIAARQRVLQQELEADPQFKALFEEAHTELEATIIALKAQHNRV